MTDQTALHAILLRQVEALGGERQVLRTEYQRLGSPNTVPSTSNTLLAQLLQQAGYATDKYRALLLDQECERAKKVEELLQALIRLTPTAEQQVQLAQVQKDEKVRLAEIAKEEKIRMEELSREKHQMNVDEKVRLAEVARDQDKEKVQAEKDEKVRLAEIAADEKVKLAQTERDGRTRLAEITESENVRLADVAKQEKVRIMELEKEVSNIQKDEKCRLKELCVEESNRHRELRWEELRRIAELQQELIPKVVALETKIRHGNAKKDETIAILQCLERLAVGNKPNDENSNDDASETTTIPTLLSACVINEEGILTSISCATEQTDVLGRVERTLNLIREMRVIFERECTAVPDADKAVDTE